MPMMKVYTLGRLKDRWVMALSNQQHNANKLYFLQKGGLL